MELEKREVAGVVIVDVKGKLVGGPDASPQFHAFFKSLIDEGNKKFVVNLRETPFASSLGIGMLIGAYTSVSNAGGELVLAHAAERIKDILVVTKLLLIFRTFDSEEEAVAYLNDRE